MKKKPFNLILLCIITIVLYCGLIYITLLEGGDYIWVQHLLLTILMLLQILMIILEGREDESNISRH